MTCKSEAVASGLAKVLGSAPAEKSKDEDKKPVRRRRPASTEKQKIGSSKPAEKPSGAKSKAPGAAPEGKTKVTYYIDAELKKRLDYAALDLDLKPSHAAETALLQFLTKHEKKQNRRKS